MIPRRETAIQRGKAPATATEDVQNVFPPLCLRPCPESATPSPTIDGSCAFSGTSPNCLVKAAPSPAQKGFFDIPFDIREDIFFLALQAQAQSHFRPYSPSEVILNPWPGLECEKGDEFEWISYQLVHYGTKYWTAMLPVCRQWYNEILAVFFTKLRFYVINSTLEQTADREFCLDFFPRLSLTMLRKIYFVCHLRWNSTPTDIDATAKMLQDYQDIAKNMTGLTSVTIGFCFPKSSDYDGDPRDLLGRSFPDHFRQKILDMMLNFSRPFKHVSQLVLGDYSELNSNTTITSREPIIMDLRDIIEQEIRSER